MKRKELEAECARLNDAAHDEYCQRDYTGNTGDYRPASHDGADYIYLSDFYGIAMCSYPVAGLSEEQCSDLLAGHNASRE